jgi:acyl-CoA synthetase (AMP-forming)/AMP-acid ligase II
VPLHHSMGLAMLLMNFYVGGRMALMAPETFVANPGTWLRAITRERAQWIGAPNFGFELCTAKVTAEQRKTLDLSSLRFVANGAELVRWPVMERFASAFAEAGFDPSAFRPGYGVSEAMGYVAGTRLPGDQPYIDLDAATLEAELRVVPAGVTGIRRRAVGCGRPITNMEAVIVGPDGAPRSSAEVGEIWLRGSSVADNYWRRPQATAERFGFRLADGSGPYLRTGDAGFLIDEQLFVLGRLDDVIIVDGCNHYPHDIEATAGAAHPALAAGRAAAFGYDEDGRMQLGIVVETKVGATMAGQSADGDGAGGDGDGVWVAEVVRSIRRAIAEEHHLHAATVLLLKPGGLPLTASGKVQRRRSRDMLMAGEHDAW